jgi:hypothetical protein
LRESLQHTKPEGSAPNSSTGDAEPTQPLPVTLVFPMRGIKARWFDPSPAGYVRKFVCNNFADTDCFWIYSHENKVISGLWRYIVFKNSISDLLSSSLSPGSSENLSVPK